SSPQIETAVFRTIRRIDDAVVLPPVGVIDPPLAEADLPHSLAVSGRDPFLALGVECTDVSNGGEYRHPAAGIADALLEFSHAGLAGNFYDAVDVIHFRQISFVIVEDHDDDSGWRTCNSRKTCSAAVISEIQSVPQRRLSIAHHSRALA